MSCSLSSQDPSLVVHRLVSLEGRIAPVPPSMVLVRCPMFPSWCVFGAVAAALTSFVYKSPRSRPVFVTQWRRWMLCEAIQWQHIGEENEGEEHARIQEFLREEKNRVNPMNHCLAAVDIFDLPAPDGSNVTFAVFPLLNFDTRLEFKTVRAAIECFLDVTRGLCFLHENAIAHRVRHTATELDSISMLPLQDIRVGNIVDNRNGRSGGRSTRYYIVDMEDAVKRRVVTGLPYPDYAPENCAPEVRPGNDHDPQAADIWQLGLLFKEISGELPIPGEMEILRERMMQPNSSQRPSAFAVLVALNGIYESLRPEHLV
ncbi:hypothetical protein CALVIDRAFT_46934 [Calocera viscosa TUFC12733]|uniref:Protein kinase domain-containing protein n=1 Tax=Calocera viscosa (strain TUFC12733) TaxID=1330018 RepID=A0A167FKF7_CALVF|nr:hypothetical protein CALVIDRAFT_46934 [Calocera viscosa TUFC12733]